MHPPIHAIARSTHRHQCTPADNRPRRLTTTAGCTLSSQAARLKTDEIFTETKQLEARVRKETTELSRMRAADEGKAVVSTDLLAAVPDQVSCLR